MPSILIKNNHKISIRLDKDIVLFNIIKPNGESLNLELTISELTALALMIDSIILEKEIR